jgi:hypothetical protein
VYVREKKREEKKIQKQESINKEAILGDKVIINLAKQFGITRGKPIDRSGGRANVDDLLAQRRIERTANSNRKLAREPAILSSSVKSRA